jgi:hypothetical protein
LIQIVTKGLGYKKDRKGHKKKDYDQLKKGQTLAGEQVGGWAGDIYAVFNLSIHGL